MFLSGLLPRPMTAEDDQKLLEHGIGFTNIVERTTKGTASLTRKEIEEGTKTLYNHYQNYFTNYCFNVFIYLDYESQVKII